MRPQFPALALLAISVFARAQDRSATFIAASIEATHKALDGKPFYTTPNSRFYESEVVAAGDASEIGRRLREYTPADAHGFTGRYGRSQYCLGVQQAERAVNAVFYAHAVDVPDSTEVHLSSVDPVGSKGMTILQWRTLGGRTLYTVSVATDCELGGPDAPKFELSATPSGKLPMGKAGAAEIALPPSIYGWDVLQRTDPMDDSKTVYLSRKTGGDEAGTLLVECRGRNPMMVAVGIDGVFDFHGEPSEVHLRARGDDYSPTQEIFVTSYPYHLARGVSMKAPRLFGLSSLRLEAPVFGQGSRVYSFDVTSLKTAMLLSGCQDM